MTKKIKIGLSIAAVIVFLALIYNEYKDYFNDESILEVIDKTQDDEDAKTKYIEELKTIRISVQKNLVDLQKDEKELFELKEKIFQKNNN